MEVPNDVAGLYKYIIGGLATAVGGLATAVGVLWRSSDAVNKSRLKERDDLRDALNAATTAIKDLNATATARNSVTDAISNTLQQVAQALALLTARLDAQHERTDKDLEVAIDVVKALSESVRQLNEEISALNTGFQIGFTKVEAKLNSL